MLHARAAVLTTLALLLPAAAPGSSLDADEADALVRARWFEGIPAERVALLEPEAVAHLDALLRDPDEVEQHAACLELLGRAGDAGAFHAIADYARRAPRGEVSGAVYRARLAIPLAWGELARRDARALGPLRALARGEAPAPDWRHRHLGPERLHAIQRRLALGALESSGLPLEAGEGAAR